MFNLKYLILLTLIFVALQDCIIKFGKQSIFVATILILITLFAYAYKNFNKFCIKICNLYKKTPFKYLIWFIIYMIITSFFKFSIQDIVSINLRIFLIYIMIVLPSILFGVMTFPQFISSKNLVKYLVTMYQFIIYYGILDYLCRIFFNVKAPLYHILCSKNYFTCLALNWSLEDFSKRACSIFFEPSFFATFLFLFIPVSYILYKSKIQIIKNKKWDKIYKLHLILISWVALFLTKSPVYILINIIYILIYFYKNILEFLKKKLFYIFLAIITIIALSINITIKQNFPVTSTSNVVINRVISVTQTFGNIRLLTIVEPSLATRILLTENTFKAALNYPVFGTGYGNDKKAMEHQLLSGDTLLTEEMAYGLYITDRLGASPNIFWSYLLQTGIVGIIILYTFFILSIYYANKLKKKMIYEYDKLILTILIAISINYLIISFYWSLDNYPMMWLIFGILNSYILNYKCSLRNNILKNKNLYTSRGL